VYRTLQKIGSRTAFQDALLDAIREMNGTEE